MGSLLKIIIIIFMTNGFIFGSEKLKDLDCIKLNTIKLNENDLFSQYEQNKVLLKYKDQCINGKLLKDIIDDISKYYIENGYITTKPYIKEQDILDGDLDITVITGVISNIVDSKTNENTWNIKAAFPFQKNKPLNLQDLETSLEMVNRVPSVESKFDITPGEKPGESIVKVDNTISKPYHLNLGLTGNKSFRDTDPDLTATFSYDNPLNINDVISYTYNGSRIQKEYQSTSGYEYNYSFPIGSYLFELIYSNTEYRQGVVGFNDIYLSHGVTKGKKLKVSKVLTRNQNHKLNLSALIYHKDTKSFFENELIEVASYKTTLAQLDLTHTYVDEWGQFITTYSYAEGKDWFGSRDDNEYEKDDEESERLEFQKHTLSAYLLYYFKDKSYKFDSSFNLQYTKDLLYYNDKILIGSDYTVRGYDDSNLYANNGYYIKNNITKTFDIKVSNNYLKSISLFLGFDYGKARCDINNEENCGEIYSGSLGFTTNSDILNTNLTWSRPLKEVGEDFKQNDRFIYNITLNF